MNEKRRRAYITLRRLTNFHPYKALFRRTGLSAPSKVVSSVKTGDYNSAKEQYFCYHAEAIRKTYSGFPEGYSRIRCIRIGCPKLLYYVFAPYQRNRRKEHFFTSCCVYRSVLTFDTLYPAGTGTYPHMYRIPLQRIPLSAFCAGARSCIPP